jgi:hypothetical protein
MTSKPSLATVLLLTLVCTASVGAKEWTVPDDFATVQEALNHARTGDTVLVREGRYKENLVWPDVDGIRLVAMDGPERTILDGGGKDRVITLIGSQGPQTLVEGFTITNGAVSGYGAGIMISDSSPTIRGNVFVDNHAIPADGTWTTQMNNIGGGGIFCRYSQARIVGNRFIRNSGLVGGGVYNFSSASLIEGNLFRECTSYNGGGAIFSLHTPGARITSNRFEDNSSLYGGAIWCFVESAPSILNNIFLRNRASAAGGAISASALSTPVIVNNWFERNEAGDGGGAIHCFRSSAVVDGNTIAQNHAPAGGAIQVDPSSAPFLQNNLFVSNRSDEGPAVLISPLAGLLFSYNALWDNAPEQYGTTDGVRDLPPTNIVADPALVVGLRTRYCLAQEAAGEPLTSPCVDAGNPLLAPLGSTRSDGVRDQNVRDIGAHEIGDLPDDPTVVVAASQGSYAPGDEVRVWVVARNLRAAPTTVNLAVSVELRGEIHVLPQQNPLTLPAGDELHLDVISFQLPETTAPMETVKIYAGLFDPADGRLLGSYDVTALELPIAP